MQVVDLDGKDVNWKVKGKIVRQDNRPRSLYHTQARDLLLKMFPTIQILEEVGIPIRRGNFLYLDFYLPIHNIVIEVHGEQHYKYTPHFHGSRIGFARSLSNDRDKEEWCEINNLNLIILPYKEDENEWRKRLGI